MMRLRLLRAGLVLAFLLALAWLGVILWGNSAGARRHLEATLGAELPGSLEVEEMRVGLGLGVTLVGVRWQDPAGKPFLDLPVVTIGWRLPLGEAPPLEVRVPTGRVEVHAASWEAASGPPALPPRGPSRLLSTPGTWRVPARALVDLTLMGLEGRVVAPRAGMNLRFGQLAARARVLSGGRLELLESSVRLAEAATVEVRGKVRPHRSDLEVTLERSSLAELGAVPPLSMVLLPLGLAPQGIVEGRVTLTSTPEQVSEARGELRVEGASLRLGPEPLVSGTTGTWRFEKRGPGLQGPVELEALEVRLSGLDVGVRDASARFELAPGLMRVARLEGEGPLGPMRGAYRLDMREGFDWALDLEVAGPEGGWLRGATVLAGPAGIRLEGVALRGKGLDVVLEAGVLPDGIDPPTWQLQDAGVFGTVPGGPVHLDGLGGVLYVDSEGGHSFFLESDTGKFQGQVTAAMGLKLWIQRAIGAELRHLDLPPAGS